jgi:cysteine-rich repeat protein
MPVPSGCVGGLPNGVVDTGEECDDSDPAAPLGCNQCVLCGNGIVTAPQEQCDDNNLTSGDGCSATCQNEVCGDGVVTGTETCDDGNAVDFIPGDSTRVKDGCPANCIVEACTPVPGSSTVVTVNLGTSGVAGITLAVDYPEGKVSIPGSGPVSSSITGLPSNVTAASNDKDFALVEVVTKSTPFATLPVGQLFRINFETCSGAAPVTADQFKCIVLSAGNGAGTDVTATCSVVVP